MATCLSHFKLSIQKHEVVPVLNPLTYECLLIITIGSYHHYGMENPTENDKTHLRFSFFGSLGFRNGFLGSGCLVFFFHFGCCVNLKCSRKSGLRRSVIFSKRDGLGER